MTLREIVLESIAKQNAGASEEEIEGYIREKASTIGLYIETKSERSFSIRMSETGEVIRRDQNGYSYKPS